MIALITGASSGIGEEFAGQLAEMGFNLILIARRKDRLICLKKELQKKYDVKIKLLSYDLTEEAQCRALYEEVKNLNIDIVINNAGFGLFGRFTDTSLERELEMIDLNIKAVHILTKLFVKDFRRRNYGYILNVASIAGYLAGPLMATYYASKNYVLQLTKAVNEELKRDKTNVYVGALCPGPVKTEFNQVAGAEFALSGASPYKVVKYSLRQMFAGKTIIIPGNEIRALAFLSKAVPSRLMLWLTYFAQTARRGDPTE